MDLITYAKSIEANIKKREKAIERLHKQIELKKEQNKRFALRAKELRKEAEGKGKPKKAAKKAKAGKKKGVKLVIKPAAPAA